MPDAVDRRTFLRYTGAAGAATGAAWVAPSVLGSTSAFAVGSVDVTKNVELWKYNQSGNPTFNRAIACSPGYIRSNVNGATAKRGTVQYTYTASTRNVCITVILSSGPATDNRDVYLLASGPNGCLAQINLGQWGTGAASFYKCGIVPVGTTELTISTEESGGGGTAVYSTEHITLTP